MTIAPSDPRYALLQLLMAYQPCNGDDDAQRRFLLAFLESTPNCFERSHTAGHFTGSAWVTDASGERVLLTHHRKLGKWLQLGGHADGEADILAVALREAQEESGLTDLEPMSTDIFDVDVHEIPARGTEAAHFHYDVRFAFRCAGSASFLVSEESNELAWIKIDEMATLTQEKSMLRMAQKWLKRRRGGMK